MQSLHKEKAYGADKRSEGTPSCRRHQTAPERKPEHPFPDVKVVPIPDQSAGHSTGRCNRTRSPLGQAESPRHDQGDASTGCARDPRSFSTAPGRLASTPAGRGHRLVTRPALDASPHTTSTFQRKLRQSATADSDQSPRSHHHKVWLNPESLQDTPT